MGIQKGWFFANARSTHRPRSLRGAALRFAICLMPSMTMGGLGHSAFATQASEVQSGSTDPHASSSTDEGLAEIVVTAELRQENLKDVPMSISAVSGEALALEHVTNIRDLAATVPNLDVAPLGPGQQIISIRGLSGERGSSSLTGIYLNNIPVSGLQDSFLATYPDVGMYDLQRVEVLKGPQGTLFGEGAVGGVVRFMTNAPDLTKYSGNVSLSLFGTDGGKLSEDLTLVANLPLVQNVFAVRLAANVLDDGGWINQPSVDRKDINNDRVEDGRIEALFTPTSELAINAMVALHHGAAGASDIVNQGSPQESNFTQGYFPNLPTISWDKYVMSNLSVTYHFDFADLLSSTSRIIRQSLQDSTQVWPPDTLQDTVDFEGYQQINRTTSQEFRLTSAAEGKFKWVAGAMYRDTSLNNTLGTQYISLFDGGFVETLLPGASTTNESKSVAGYGDLSYKITQSFEVGAGIRYLHDQRSAYEPGVADSQEAANFNVPTYRYFASYSIVDDVKVYASVGTGFRSGGFNDISTVQLGAPATFGPEHDKSYEVGVKSEFFDRRVSVDAAVYYSSYRDLQDDSVTRNAQGTTIQYTNNAQSADLRGVEWDAAWRATTDLTLHLAGDVMNTKIVTASSASSYSVGDPIDFVPRYSVMVGADYKLNWAVNLPGVVHVDFNRKGQSYDTLNGLEDNYGTPDQVKAAPVNFLNLSLSAMRDGWTFTAFGRNLTDERGYIRPGSSGWQSQARPLNAGITISKDF
jgi:iron complex outermembrane receptor protein